MVVKFIHCADLHLGRVQNNLEQRFLDFGNAFRYVVEEALTREVDALLVSGDLFDKRNINARTLEQAVGILEPLKTAGIPVIAIEGNHDKAFLRDKESWMSFLAHRGYIILLNPEFDGGKMLVEPYDAETDRGCYIDLDEEVRVYGLGYLGRAAGQKLQELAGILPEDKTNIVLLHAMVGRMGGELIGSIPKGDVACLQDRVTYLALGHGHNRYVVEKRRNPYEALYHREECSAAGEGESVTVECGMMCEIEGVAKESGVTGEVESDATDCGVTGEVERVAAKRDVVREMESAALECGVAREVKSAATNSGLTDETQCLTGFCEVKNKVEPMLTVVDCTESLHAQISSLSVTPNMQLSLFGSQDAQVSLFEPLAQETSEEVVVAPAMASQSETLSVEVTDWVDAETTLDSAEEVIVATNDYAAHWGHNPGSLEHCRLDEAEHHQGFFYIEIEGRTVVKAEHIASKQRPARIIAVDITGSTKPEEAYERIFTAVQEGVEGLTNLLLRLVIQGEIGFDILEIDEEWIRNQIEVICAPLILEVDIRANLPHFSVVTETDMLDRKSIEQQVLSRKVEERSQWRHLGLDLVQLILEIKEDVINGLPADEVAAKVLHMVGDNDENS